MVSVPRPLRAAAVLAAAAVTLTACGATGATGSKDSAGGSFKATDCPTQPKTTWAKPADGAHTVPTAMGDVKVPADPKRVVVLDTAELDSALTLGVKPVGATHADVESGFLSYLPKDKVAGIKDVGTIGSADMEAVAALKPDLILTSKMRDAQRYDQLKKIAPTVMTEKTGYPWKQNFATHADALGKIPEGKKIAAAYEKHAAEVTDALGGREAAAKKTTNVVRFMEGADTRVYGCESYIGAVLDDIGTAPTDVVKNAKDGLMTEIGPEQITRADADTIFYTAYGSPEKSKESQVTGGALWKNMKAVKSGNTFRVNDELWLQGIGYTAADKILDELQKNLTK
ncbi:iron-siderophore ABC transporter substrate-binding protein [Streptomyces sp. NPDC050315]|uniref:ABC transporter substrate-binding protein n=1 Tax=Streptomyces sp. NPDC050315 TaxID=3155039 RepID=UPI003423294D